jgi:ABC-type glycerol-3-phosphate transport system substrate-binding protein
MGGAASFIALAGCTGGDGGDGDGGGDGGSGGDGGGSTGGGGAEIRVLTSETAEASKAVHQDIKSTFEQETDHTVKFEYVSFAEKIERLSTMIRGGNAPVLADGNVSSVGAMFNEDLLAPMPETRASIEEQLGEIPDTMVLRSDGEPYMLPFAHKMQNQTVRKDLIEQTGGSFSSFDVGWDTHVNWVRNIHQETDVAGIGLATGRTGKAHQDTLQYLWTNGVDVVDGPSDNIEVVLDSGENQSKAVEVLEYMNELWQYSTQQTGWTWGDAGEAFSSGGVSDVNYSIGRMMGLSMDKGQSWAPGEIGFVEPPFKSHKDDGRQMVTAPTGFGLIKQAENVEAGKELLQHFMTYDDGQLLIDFLHSVPYHLTPTIPGIFESDAYRQNDLIQQRPDIIEKQKELLPVSASPGLTADNSGFNPIAGPSYGEGTLGAMVSKVVSQGMDPQTAVTQAAEELRGLQ